MQEQLLSDILSGKIPARMDYHIKNNYPILYDQFKQTGRPFIEAAYLYIYPNTNLHCKMCGKDLEWKRDWNKAFGTYCSTQCRYSDKDLIDKIQSKRKTTYELFGDEINRRQEQTMLSRYGVRNALCRDSEMRAEQIKTRTEHEYIYRRQVTTLTNRNKHHLDLSTIGLCGTPGATQVDHIVPVKYGYLNDIPPELIASSDNLQIIPWEENRQKWDILTEDAKQLLMKWGR